MCVKNSVKIDYMLIRKIKFGFTCRAFLIGFLFIVMFGGTFVICVGFSGRFLRSGCRVYYRVLGISVVMCFLVC